MRLFLSNFQKYNIDLVKLNSDTVDRADILKLLLNSCISSLYILVIQENH